MTTVRQPDEVGFSTQVLHLFLEPLPDGHFAYGAPPGVSPPMTIGEAITAAWMSDQYERDVQLLVAGYEARHVPAETADAMHKHLRPTAKGALHRCAELHGVNERVHALLRETGRRQAAFRYGRSVAEDIAQQLMLYADHLQRDYDPARSNLDTYISKRIKTKSLPTNLGRIVGLVDDRTTSIDDDQQPFDWLRSRSDDPHQEVVLGELRGELAALRIAYPEVFEYLDDGVKQQDLAAKHGVSKQAMSKRIKTGLARIREHLRRRGFGDFTDL